MATLRVRGRLSDPDLQCSRFSNTGGGFTRADCGNQANHKIESHSLELLKRQYELGQVTRLDVAAQEATLAQTQAGLRTLEKQLSQQRDLLIRLTGRFPNDVITGRFDLLSLQLPQELPVSLPYCLTGSGNTGLVAGRREGQASHVTPEMEERAFPVTGIDFHEVTLWRKGERSQLE